MRNLAYQTFFAVAGIVTAQSATIFAPGDTVFGIQSDGTNFNVGVEGTVQPANNWPAGEPPAAAIDGAGQKYLNFGKENTGILVTGSLVAGAAQQVILWTANDSEPRDPASVSIYGTDIDVSGGGSFAISDFTAIATDLPVALPASRNPGGVEPLDPANSVAIGFSNSTAYASYAVIFPTLKDSGAANSMQIAEIQLDTAAVPEPGSAVLAGLAGVGLMLRRRRHS